MPLQPNGRWRVDPRPCGVCGTIFKPTASNDRKGYGFYCGLGCYRSTPRLIRPEVERLTANTRKTDTCWLWTGDITARGYGRVASHEHGHLLAHRVAWEAVAGPIPAGKRILHTCDNRPCVRNDESGVYVVDGIEYPRWGHLFLATPAVNTADMVAKNRSTQGERNTNAKLTDTTVRQIRRLYAEGRTTHQALADTFGVTPSLITMVINRKIWRHIQ